MPKRLTDDDPSNTQPPKKRFTQSLSADHDSEGARLTPTTELPTLPHQAAATFSDFTPMNDATPGLTEDTARRTSTPCAPTNVVEPQRRPECFRISGIPSDWSIDNLKKQLQVIDPNLSFSDVDLSGPFPSCCDSTQTALLNFDNCTAYFQKLERNDEKLIVIREDTPDRKVRLTIDKHFYDLTPMNNPEAPITAELVRSLLVTCSTY